MKVLLELLVAFIAPLSEDLYVSVVYNLDWVRMEHVNVVVK